MLESYQEKTVWRKSSWYTRYDSTSTETMKSRYLFRVFNCFGKLDLEVILEKVISKMSLYCFKSKLWCVCALCFYNPSTLVRISLKCVFRMCNNKPTRANPCQYNQTGATIINHCFLKYGLLSPSKVVICLPKHFVWWMLKAYLRYMFTEILGLWIGVSKSLLLDFTPYCICLS